MTEICDRPSFVAALLPEDTGPSLEAWLRSNGSAVEEALLERGALLLRGFPMSRDRFGSVVEELSDVLMTYEYGSTPRTEYKTHLYSSTDYPAHMSIPQHCECAYQNTWPSRLFFYSEKVAEAGGETPLSGMRSVTAAIDESVKDAFRERGLKYVRNYSPGVDVPWQKAFRTDSRTVVEEICARERIELEWQGDCLRTEQVCKAFVAHPLTGEEIWFNQAHLFHPSSIPPELLQLLRSMVDELPRNVCFADGGEIPAAMLADVRRAFDAHAKRFAWRAGDVLVLDNVLTSHGRSAFRGERTVLVSMGNPVRVS